MRASKARVSIMSRRPLRNSLGRERARPVADRVAVVVEHADHRVGEVADFAGLTSIGGFGTSPASGTLTWLKSGLPPGRTLGSGTCSERRGLIERSSGGDGARRSRGILAPPGKECHARLTRPPPIGFSAPRFRPALQPRSLTASAALHRASGKTPVSRRATECGDNPAPWNPMEVIARCAHSSSPASRSPR